MQPNYNVSGINVDFADLADTKAKADEAKAKKEAKKKKDVAAKKKKERIEKEAKAKAAQSSVIFE